MKHLENKLCHQAYVHMLGFIFTSKKDPLLHIIQEFSCLHTAFVMFSLHVSTICEQMCKCYCY